MRFILRAGAVALALAGPAATFAAQSAFNVPLPPPPTLPPPAAPVSTPAPVPAAAPAERAATAAAGRGWVDAALGVGQWADLRLGDARSGFSAGLGATWLPAPSHSLRLDLGLDRYRRAYAVAGVNPATGAALRPDVNESRWSAGITYGYEILHRFAPGRNSAELLVGGSYLSFDDKVAPASALPLGAGLRLARAVGEGAELFADGFYGWAVSAKKPGDASIEGAVKSLARYGAGVAWHHAGARVEAGYRGETLTLDHGYRLLHSLGLRLGFDF